METKVLATSVLAAVLTIGCASTGEQNGMWGGAAAGGALGAIIGDAVDCKGCALIGSAAGALLGGTVGRNVGRRMDQVDAQRSHYASNSKPTGQTTTWSNPDTGTQ